jgi:shikimate kinase
VRINVIGTSGSGKTTFGKKLAKTLSIPFLEMDAIF